MLTLATGTLAALGLLVQGGVATQAFPAWDLSQLRYFGVLQRIAACFVLASLVVLYIPESRPLAVHVRARHVLLSMLVHIPTSGLILLDCAKCPLH